MRSIGVSFDRWNVSEARVPVGGTQLCEPGLFEQHRGYISALGLLSPRLTYRGAADPAEKQAACRALVARERGTLPGDG